jgi:hypothetical protein
MPTCDPEDAADWDEDGSDWSADDEEYQPDDDDDEGEPTVPCPYCKREIHEDAQQCPYCEHSISAEDAPPARKPWWIVVGTLLCLFVIYFWVAGR